MPPSNFSEVGTSGLNRYAGYVTEEEFIPQLAGKEAIRTFKQMRDNDPIIGAWLFVMDNLMRQVDWRVDPAGDSSEQIEDAEFVDSCREDMSGTWADVISEIISMFEYGWSFLETVYKRRLGPDEEDPTKNSRFNDSKIGWRKMSLRAQETLDRWKFDDDGGIQALIQRPPPDYKDREILIKRGLLFRTTTRKNNPEGRSLLRNAYRPWYYKQRIEEVEGVGIERDLAGLPMATVDPEILSPNASVEQKAMLDGIKAIVTGVRRDKLEGVVFPRAYDEDGNLIYEFSLLSSGGARQFDTSGIIERKNREIAMTVLADFILLGHEAVGSFALSSDKTSLFATAITSFLDSITDVFNRYAIPRLLALNGMDIKDPPKLAHGEITQPDLAIIGTFISALSTAGFPLFPDPKLQGWLRQIAKMPEMDEEDEPTEVPEPRPPKDTGPDNPEEDDVPDEENEQPS
jgi:hypothetical protein